MPSQTLTINLPPGPVGAGINITQNGNCYVKSIEKPNSPLQVNDILVSMNGIVFKDVQSADGGNVVHDWAKLIQAFSAGTRTLVVVRPIRAEVRGTAALPVPEAVGSKPAAAASVQAPPVASATVSTAAAVKAPDVAVSMAQQPHVTIPQKPQATKEPPKANPNALKPINGQKPNSTVPTNDPLYERARNQLLSKINSIEKKPKPAKAATKPKKSKLEAKHKIPKPTKAKPVKQPKEEEWEAAYGQLLSSPLPLQGHLSPSCDFYITLNNETVKDIAGKLGLDDFKLLCNMRFNSKFYGKLTASILFKAGTIVMVPKDKCSRWMMNKLIDNSEEELAEMATCSKCLVKEKPDDVDQMLMCDGCDLTTHMSCAGLTTLPTGDWLCTNCLEVLAARKKWNSMNGVTKDENGVRCLKARLPPLPKLSDAASDLASKAIKKFKDEIRARKTTALNQLNENQRVLERSLKERVEKIQSDLAVAKVTAAEEEQLKQTADIAIRRRYGLISWSVREVGSSVIKYSRPDGSIATASRNYRERSHDWNRVYRKVQACSQERQNEPHRRNWEAAKERVNSLQKDLDEALREEKQFPVDEREQKTQLLLDFAALLGEGKLDCETVKHYADRVGTEPRFLGVILAQESDILALNLLREPAELVLSIPVNGSVISIDAEPVEIGREYFLYGTEALFSSSRNDLLPLDFGSRSSVRQAQRDLIAILLRDPRNSALQVTAPSVPSSVVIRGNENMGHVLKCFDLSELVRDCQYPMNNQPIAETPKRLADNGLVLREYQKASLKWLLDKENNSSGLGSSGELWSRMRSGEKQFFYCELTGSIVNDIFESDRKDASRIGGGCFPAGAIIGSEMGMGKTVIALSLVVANPPAAHNQALPREHIARISHPDYTLPPSVGSCTSTTSKHSYLSNGCLVIAPMTLCAQWKSEVERFAPWMKVLTLHNDECDSVQEIASNDIVIISTFLLSSSASGKTNRLFNTLKRIHFHRIFLDEAHYNNTGERVKLTLSQLSATHRYCLTGTPVGHSLADLHGQLQFLRVPIFSRSAFWTYNISTPYTERSVESLTVLRQLLSRVVIRHSKEQTLQNGQSLVSLPPRIVETLILPFGSEAEERSYKYLEARNTQYFMELRGESPSTVLGKFMELSGMLFTTRMLCAHASLASLDNIQGHNIRIAARRERINLGNQKPKHKTQSNGPKTITRATIFEDAVRRARISAQGRMREAVLQFQEGGDFMIECPICLDPVGEEKVALTPCAHKFCEECIVSCLEAKSQTREPEGTCPHCRDTFKKSELTFLGSASDAGAATDSELDLKPSALKQKEVTNEVNGFVLSTKDIRCVSGGASDLRAQYELPDNSRNIQERAIYHTIPPEFLNDWNEASSIIGTKTSRLLEEIRLMSSKDPTNKCVVFSQFLGSLDVAAEEMTARGIRFVRVDGMMKQHHRADALHSFTNDPNTMILLLSMKAGAAGLNLMAANYCFLMDPATNSAIEEQAIDRIHRIGQTREVFVKRLIMKDTIEERIVSNRRSLAADRPSASTQIDGTVDLMETGEDKVNTRPTKRQRQEDEQEMTETSFQRLQQLEALFGCSSFVKVHKA